MSLPPILLFSESSHHPNLQRQPMCLQFHMSESFCLAILPKQLNRGILEQEVELNQLVGW
jgi:hypothetical protein